VAASLVLRWILGPVGHLGATLPGVGTGRSFVVEWLLSFILMFVIISVATDERVTAGFAGIAVGLTVGFEAMMGGPLTGASMNPARSLGPAVAGGGWDGHWIYWVAPITAMLVAVRVYDFLRPASVDHEREQVPLGVEGPVSAATG
jgi:aquaporin Z